MISVSVACNYSGFARCIRNISCADFRENHKFEFAECNIMLCVMYYRLVKIKTAWNGWMDTWYFKSFLALLPSIKQHKWVSCKLSYYVLLKELIIFINSTFLKLFSPVILTSDIILLIYSNAFEMHNISCTCMNNLKP